MVGGARGRRTDPGRQGARADRDRNDDPEARREGHRERRSVHRVQGGAQRLRDRDVPDLDAAIELAKGWPVLETIEVRPVVEERDESSQPEG